MNDVLVPLMGAGMLRAAPNDEPNNTRIVLGLLESVERDDSQSQRKLASDHGIALEIVSAYLKHCVKKGLLKIGQAPPRRWLISNSDDPTAIPDGVIEALKRREDADSFIKLDNRKPFRPRDEIRILDGVFASCSACSKAGQNVSA